MTLTALEIYLSKSLKILAPSSETEEDNRSIVGAFNVNLLLKSGYVFSPDLMQVLSRCPSKPLTQLLKKVEKHLSKTVGAHKTYSPMYPDFPKQVMEASEYELFINAFIHYLGSYVGDLTGIPVRLLPKYHASTRQKLPDEETLPAKMVTLGSEEDFSSIFTSLCTANVSLSPSDKEYLVWFARERKDLLSTLPAIPNKENLAILGGFLFGHPDFSHIAPQFRTATDVLRLAVAASDGDVSLAENTKFRSFTRGERRLLLTLLEQISNPLEDMARYSEVWKRLGHMVHAADHTAKFPKACAAIDAVRKGNLPQTFNSKVEASLLAKDAFAATDLLVARPGDFSRRLDHLIRTAAPEEIPEILDQYRQVAGKASTPVLMQTYAHFRNRKKASDIRVFFPKGNETKVQSIPNVLKDLPEGTEDAICDCIKSVLVTRFSSLPPLGNTFVDPLLKEQAVPFALRSASKALRTIARGSWLPLPEDTEILRFFIWWKQADTRADIDLSACYMNENFTVTSAVWYGNLRQGGALHSGDITSAPNGACEFIDVPLNESNKVDKDKRYVVMLVKSFTGQSFESLPECFAGWMSRQDGQKGKIFDARTVADKIDLTSSRKVAAPLLFDLKEKKALWMDVSLPSTRFHINVKDISSTIHLVTKALASMSHPNLYDLFSFHAQARGVVVSTKEEAKTVFSLTEGITPFDQGKILSEYLR